MDAAQYIIMANLCIAVLLGFYLLFLKKETFFQLNRVYLLGSLFIAFIIPNIQTSWATQLDVTQQLKYTIQAEPVNIFANAPVAQSPITLGQVILFSYLAGVIILALNLFTRLLAVKNMIASADGPASYSFFQKIHLGGQSVSPLICEHENIHAKQWHSADIMLMEIVVIFNWFNPAVYFFRKELKNVHEFIADEGALRSANSKKEYALLLLSQTFETPINNLVNTFFNQNLLKQRIMMIQKNKSRKGALLKYGLSAPLFALMIILSSATMNKTSVVILKSENNLTDTTKTDKGPLFTEVEQEPTYPGGSNKLYAFLKKNIKYPTEMRQKKVEGRVFVGFVVEKDGSLSEIKVLRGLGYGSDQEALRVLAMSPKWNPGIQNGRKVRVQYTIPILFKLKG
jgi:TonB family protein